jgi:glycine/D-amino acid oxidase-like deaminating enzyme
MSVDAIVVGAGIVGAACAAELAAEGMTVEVIDAAGIGSGTTAAGMGHVVVMNDSPAEFALSRYSRGLWLDLAPQLRERDAFVRCGTLWAAEDDVELEAARTMRDAFANQGVRAAMLDAAALREAEPALAHSLQGGLLVEDDGIVYAPAASEWLLMHSPHASRIRVLAGRAVREVRSGSVTLADGEHRPASHVVVANGLAARDLLPNIALTAKKGHLLITDRYPRLIRHQLLELGYIKSAHQMSGTSVAFNVQPRPTGQLLIGSSRQFGTEDAAVDMEIMARMLRRAARYLPALPALNGIRAWTGLRAASPDGLPMIGAAGDTTERVWMAIGHEGLGVTTSLGTAKLLAAQMLGRRHELPAQAFSPQRFIGEHAHG